MATPDPIPATFQFLALAEADGPDAADRELLGALKARLREVSDAGAVDAWLAWYREALDAARVLSTRWGARRSRPAGADAVRASGPTDIATVRMRESAGPFVQRWGSRLHDQSHQVRDQLIREASTLVLKETEGPAQVTFELPHDACVAFGLRTRDVLNSWSTQVAERLTPSWHEWLLGVMAEERLGRTPNPPPAWPHAHLSTSAALVPHIEPGAARRTTPFAAFLRAMSTGRGCASVVVAAVPALIGMVVGGQAGSNGAESALVGAGIGTAITAVIAIPFGIIYGQSLTRDERDHVRRDLTQRLHSSLHSWIGTTVEAHRNRIVGAIASSSQELRPRLAAWVEASWDSGSRKIAPATDSEREVVFPLISSLAMTRSALAARIAQLELQVRP